MSVEPAKAIDGEIEAPKKNGNGKRKGIAIADHAPVIPLTESAALITMLERAARDPAVDISKMERLFEMHQKMLARESEAAFNAAMAAAQSELKTVTRKRDNSQTKSKYADLAAIADEAMPTIYEHGFGASCSEFKSDKPDHLGIALEVMHRAGHSKRYEFHVPFDGTGMKGNPNKTQTHAYGSTATYGRRYAICCVFNIATKDDDGNAAASDGALISDEQAAAINSKIEELGADVEKFCAYLNVERVSDIQAKHYEGAMIVLDAKRRAKK